MVARPRTTELAATILLVVLYASMVTSHFEEAVFGDTWFVLAFGRDVLEHGLPHTNDVTVIGMGTWWINGQWLGQVLWNRIHDLGGFSLCMVVYPLLEALGLALGVLAARRTGASSLRIAMGLLLGLALLPKFSIMRAQTFAWSMLGIALWLVVDELVHARDARGIASRRLWLGVPLLVLWTNLHGSGVVGAGLLGLAALMTIVQRRTERKVVLERVAMGIAFIGGALASPYWLPPYWIKMTTDAGPFIDWAAPTIQTAPVHIALVVVVGLGLLYTWKKLDRRFAIYLAVMSAISLLSMRYALVLAFGLIVFGPALFDAALEARAAKPRRLRAVVGIGIVVYAASLVWGFVRVPDALDRRWPPGVVDQPYAEGNVLAHEQLGDWLLFTHPELRQRVLFNCRAEVAAYDEWARFGEITRGAIERIDELPDVRHVVLYASAPAVEKLRESEEWEEVFPDPHIVVFSRP